ncbi:MAG: selenide, water dikinase SelD, partial [Hyphomicrobiaceae bacterium]
VGAGAGGIELALSVRYAIRRLLRKAEIGGSPRICIVSGESDVLSSHNPQVRKTFRTIIDKRGIELHLNSYVERVGADGVHTARDSIKLDEIIWVTGASAPAWIARSGIARDERGFMEVDPNLQSTSHPEIFGAGDIVSVVGYPRPKSGVFAVRQGPPLEANLRRAVLGHEPREFRPQRAFLSLISTGGKHAVASRGGWSVAGNWVWQWKDGIDRRFMDKFNKLPEMTADPRRPVAKLPAALATAEVQQQLGDQDMRCGGCGAKVGAATLTSILEGLDVAERSDVVAGLNSPDDAAITTAPPGRHVVQTIDAFRAMVDDPFVFGQIAANHCLGDVYAMAAEPQTAMAVATLPAGLPEKTAALLGDLMAGATSVLNEADCALVGGHTGEGAELSLGFAITGHADPDKVTRKSGLEAGDTLIVTKPLGTGTIFAAEMRAKAKGRWVQGAIAMALQSNRDAAGVLQDFDVHACTDVTGFGLIGHLSEMLAVADVAAWLDPDKVAALDGALECISAGFVSTLQDENLRKRDIVAGIDHRIDDPAIQLMFDPQTAGGLLAGVPTSAATDCIIELRAAGYPQAATIGEVIAMPDDGAQIVLRPSTKVTPCSAMRTA